ncbi:uncharacterized protein LOC134242280 [Saccostrea cucullata]|uniref:uncharacterized protein LOC134242280 n=1 Tax=Saccostrea cuccullata TaxID=36930 RepID=UPI002ED286F4
MSKRENLNKLRVNSLKEIAHDQGIEIKKKKKEDLIREILTSQVPLIDLTPVTKSKEVLAECISPATGENENLPPYNAVHYKIQDQSQIPTISFSDIYNFMILRPKSTGGSVNNFKGLDRAVKHFEAGHVQDISVSEINTNIIYISAKCQASMKKHQYQVYLCLSRNGQSVTNIHHGYCQCPVGLGQSCSHIGSLLFALSHIKPQESCTSKPCKWVVPKGRSKKPTGK